MTDPLHALRQLPVHEPPAAIDHAARAAGRAQFAGAAPGAGWLVALFAGAAASSYVAAAIALMMRAYG